MSAVPAEQRPAPGPGPASAAPPPAPARPGPNRPGRRAVRWSGAVRPGAQWWATLLLAGMACFVTFMAKGGLKLEAATTTEIALTLGAGVVGAAAVMLTPRARSLVEGPRYGLWPVGLLFVFTVFSGLSIVWSVQPDISWQDTGRLLAYSGVFGASVALVRLVPDRWPAILGGLTLGAVVVCGYALLTKVFPRTLAPGITFARLEEPYGYWNAIGLTAAMGAIGCVWLGARRAGHALLNALAYPAMGILLVTLMLAYSRGALAAMVIGLALWFCIVPLRLRGAAVLVVGGLGAAGVVGWDFSRRVLTTDNIPLGERVTAGHQLGVLLVAMVAVLTLAGIAIGFFTGRRAPGRRVRRRAGAVLLALVALAPVVLAGVLAQTHRGLTGSISHAAGALTNPNAKPPPNTPGRLTAVASVRARYWKEALQVFDANPVVGTGTDGFETASLRYRRVLLEVKHAHGFVVQTLADLGAIGIGLALGLLLTWMAAAGRATHPLNRSWTGWRAWLDVRRGARPGWRRSPRPYTPERIGMLSMLCLVVVFGVHSLVDWTWYVPGNAFAALVCAGWLAGRGPLEAWSGEDGLERPRLSLPHSPRELRPMRIGVALCALIAALLAAWSLWQPQRSADASQEALNLLASNPRAALARAQAGVTRDPLSAQALITLAAVQQAAGEPALAKATLQRAVRLQPSNPQTWLALARHDLAGEPAAAVKELQAGIFLDPVLISPEAIAPPNASPEAVEIYDDYVQALRASSAASTGTGRKARP